jgi:phosphoribosylformylglycinamidine cyclo-ligase
MSLYRSTGVDYAALDAGKRDALTAALSTSALLDAKGGSARDDSRGEPAFVFRIGTTTLAFVLECLGTKSLIARAVAETSGENRFADVAYDTVAAIVNDLCCVGATPLVVNAYFSTGSSEWYADAGRHAALIDGWRRACEDVGATWGGGESPSLPGLVSEADIELAGSAVGVLPPGVEPILGQNLQAGDEIVLIESSGLHTNGSSLARRLADPQQPGHLEGGYAHALPSGARFGDALLAPTIAYSPLVDALLAQSTPIHYLSHITGHGLLKLMRPARPLTYEIDALPPVPEVLACMVEAAAMDAHTAYSTLNMGCGFAIYCAAGAGESVVELARALGYRALLAGHVSDGPRRVILRPVGVEYASDELDLAPRRGA